jgi:NTP pyrophosphatase (non-canonical NTP hydrolase)
VINDRRIETIAQATRARAGSSAVLETALMLAEESGEAIQQLRRHLGLARRSATVDEVGAELADVAIVACVLSRLLGIDLDQAVSTKLDEGIR